MARKATPSGAHVAPTITPQRAIDLIGRQLQQFDTVIRVQRDNPEVSKWTSTTEQILRAAFGEPHGADHEMLQEFKNAGAIFMFTTDTPDS
jgi:hypothetical protein